MFRLGRAVGAIGARAVRAGLGWRGAVLAPIPVAVTLVGFSAAPARATDAHLPPWPQGVVAPWVRSVHITDADEPLRAAARADASRRGSAALGARLPFFGARLGPDCRGWWLHVGPEAWVCQDRVELSERAPVPAVSARRGAQCDLQPAGASPSGAGPGAMDELGARLDSCPHWKAAVRPDGLPYLYYFVAPPGTAAYQHLEQADVGDPAMTLAGGFAVAIVSERRLGAVTYGETNHGLWVPMRDLSPARPLAFAGSSVPALVEGVIPFAWVNDDRARLYRRAGQGFQFNGSFATRFQKVGYLERVESPRGDYVRVSSEAWIAATSIRHPGVAAPPPESRIDRGERWIDVELSSQTLVAYQGARPVFATLVSTGKGRGPSSPTATPLGVHRIWVKLLTSDMDNLEDDNASRYYRIESVPYVQYFAKGVGLHAAFWHRSLGRVRSHGCVNLSPLDARRLFWWTGPRLPDGWTAALPTEHDRGTIVRVR